MPNLPSSWGITTITVVGAQKKLSKWDSEHRKNDEKLYEFDKNVYTTCSVELKLEFWNMSKLTFTGGVALTSKGVHFLQQMPISVKEVSGNNQVPSKFLMLKQSQSLASICTQEPNVVRECLYLPQKLEKFYTDLIRCIAHWTMWYSFIAFFSKNNYLLLPKIDRHFYLIFLHVANLQLTRTICLRSA